MRPFISGSIAALILAFHVPHAAGAADPVEQPSAKPVDVSSVTVPRATDEARARAQRLEDGDLVAELPARRTDDFGLVGVTWDPGFDRTDMTVEVRLRSEGGWADWEPLDIESSEGEGGRDGTEPLWIGSADGVAVRVASPTGTRPAGLAVATIDPGTTAVEVSPPTVSAALYRTSDGGGLVQVAEGSPTFTPASAIVSRSSWGAKKNTYCDSPRTGNETRGVLVHHTAGTNDYSKSQSASIVRAVQAYHMQSRDWCDIGYNFLVDRYGQIFEGRNGGVDKPVRGAHAGEKNVNTYTMGVSMMGTFTSSEPSGAQKTAMVELLGWRLGTTFHPATGSYGVGGYNLQRIAAHLNVVSTACPGAAAYTWLSRTGGLRARVQAYVSHYSTPVKTLWTSLGSSRTGPVYVGEYGSATNRKLRSKYTDLYSKTGIGAFYTSGYFRQEFNAVGSQSGYLGYPTANSTSTPIAAVQRQTFQNGRIYRVVRSSTPSAFALWGKVAGKYVELGETGGVLGAPRKRLTNLSPGLWRAYFDHGVITREKDGSVSVTIS